MCLHVDAQESLDFRKQNLKAVTVYKVVKNINGQLLTPYMDVPVDGKSLSIRPDEKIKMVKNTHGEYLIHEGIHVFLNKDIANGLAGLSSNREVLIAKGKLSDFAACNSDKTEAVFKKITFI
jgi:hypothetical protein